MKYNEIWKDIYDFPDKYEVSNYGRIRNKITNHIYKNTNKKGDYFVIILYDEKNKRSTRIHREVAKAFIPNPNNYKEVNHKDGNKQNNCVDNLEWCDRKQNQLHALKHGLNTINHLNNYNKNKCYNKYGLIVQYDKDKKELNRFYSVKEASIKTGVCSRNILQVINHEEGRTQAGGYIWKSEKEVVSNDL